MLGPLMFDLFIKVYFIDRKLIATSECHFDDNLNFMQNCFSRRRKTDYIFVILPSTKLPLYLKNQREVPHLDLFSTAKENSKGCPFWSFFYPSQYLNLNCRNLRFSKILTHITRINFLSPHQGSEYKSFVSNLNKRNCWIFCPRAFIKDHISKL